MVALSVPCSVAGFKRDLSSAYARWFMEENTTFPDLQLLAGGGDKAFPCVQDLLPSYTHPHGIGTGDDVGSEGVETGLNKQQKLMAAVFLDRDTRLDLRGSATPAEKLRLKKMRLERIAFVDEKVDDVVEILKGVIRGRWQGPMFPRSHLSNRVYFLLRCLQLTNLKFSVSECCPGRKHRSPMAIYWLALHSRVTLEC